MSAYSDYFDRQSPSVELRRRLLTLPESGPGAAAPRPWPLREPPLPAACWLCACSCAPETKRRRTRL